MTASTRPACCTTSLREIYRPHELVGCTAVGGEDPSLPLSDAIALHHYVDHKVAAQGCSAEILLRYTVVLRVVSALVGSVFLLCAQRITCMQVRQTAALHMSLFIVTRLRHVVKLAVGVFSSGAWCEYDQCASWFHVQSYTVFGKLFVAW